MSHYRQSDAAFADTLLWRFDAFQITDTAVFMGLMRSASQLQQQQQLSLQLHGTADELMGSRHSSASDVSASATDSPTLGDTSLPVTVTVNASATVSASDVPL